MQYAEDDDLIIAKLDDGEDLFKSIQAIVDGCEIDQALVLSGIGMLKDFTVGYFNGQEYEWKHYHDAHELVAMHGSIAGGVIHLHCAVVSHDHHVKGGHLKLAKVCVLNELVLRKMKTVKLGREKNQKSGLAELTVSRA